MVNIKIIIAGSRGFTDYTKLKAAVFDIVENIKRDGDSPVDITIVSGGARGADRLGERYGHEYGYKVVQFIPDWDTLGKKAGYLRNVSMAEYASRDCDKGVLIAFWDGDSAGTGHMINIAKRNGLEVHVVEV